MPPLRSGNTSASRLRQLVSLQSTVDGEDELSDADDDDEDGEFDEDDGGADMDEIELSAEDQASLEMFMPKSNTVKSKSLADIILDKIREKEEQAASGGAAPGANVKFGAGFGMPVTANTDEAVRAKLDPKIVEVYTKSVPAPD